MQDHGVSTMPKRGFRIKVGVKSQFHMLEMIDSTGKSRCLCKSRCNFKSSSGDKVTSHTSLPEVAE